MRALGAGEGAVPSHSLSRPSELPRPPPHATGMATTDRNVTDGAFNVLASITTYLNRAFGTLDALLDTVGGTSDM